MKTLLALIAGVALCTSVAAYAAEPPHNVDLGDITGHEIALKMHDHAFAGSIKDFVMWGFVDEDTFSAEMIMRKDKQTVRTIFKKQENGKIGGQIKHVVDGKDVVTTLELKKVNAAAKQIVFEINGVEAIATVSAEWFEGGHHINPAVTLDYNGETIAYKMIGQGCYGYLMFSAMAIVGAYIH